MPFRYSHRTILSIASPGRSNLILSAHPSPRAALQPPLAFAHCSLPQGLALPCLLDKGLILLHRRYLLREAFPDTPRELVNPGSSVPHGALERWGCRGQGTCLRTRAVFCPQCPAQGSAESRSKGNIT